MTWKYLGFGCTNPSDRVLHLLWTVLTHTGSFYSFSTRTTALLLHLLIGKKNRFFFFFPLFSKYSRKSLVCGRIKGVTHTAWLKFFNLITFSSVAGGCLQSLRDSYQKSHQGAINPKAGGEM